MKKNKPNKYELFLLSKKRAATYTRVSTLDQKEKGTSLETQKEICRNTCNLKNYDIIAEYTDAISGTVPAPKRKGFAEFLNEARKGKFDVLVFYCFDRLARELRVFLGIIDELRSLGIKIVSCKEQIDTNTDQGDFMMNIYASVSNLELRTIRTRLMNGKLHKLNLTGYAGGRIPYGYKVINKTVVVDREKAKIVKFIFNMHKKGVSWTKIAHMLTEQNISPPRDGKQWYARGIGTIIRNKDKYNGALMNNNKNNVRWPNILTEI